MKVSRTCCWSWLSRSPSWWWWSWSWSSSSSTGNAILDLVTRYDLSWIRLYFWKGCPYINISFINILCRWWPSPSRTRWWLTSAPRSPRCPPTWTRASPPWRRCWRAPTAGPGQGTPCWSRGVLLDRLGGGGCIFCDDQQEVYPLELNRFIVQSPPPPTH